MSHQIVPSSSKDENNLPVRTSDFAKICRTCLTTKNITPICLLKYCETFIVNFMESCASIHVEEDDCLPQNLCSVCLQEIIKIQQFQEKCKQKESLLRVVLAEVVKHENIKEEEVEEFEIEIPTNYFDSDSESNTENKCLEERKKPVCQTIKKGEDNVPVHVSDFGKICRTCLSTENIMPISVLKYNGTSTVSLMVSCASINVEENDSLPQNLCFVCLDEIIKIHQFQEKCKQNDNLLRAVLTEPEVVKQEPDDIKIKQEEMLTNAFALDNKNTEETKIKTEKITFSCAVCVREFSSQEELQKHCCKYACVVCGKVWDNNCRLRQHMRVHTKEKPYKCSVCLQDFSLNGALKRHMMQHTGERPHVCDFCGKANTLRKHLRTHAACDSKFACSVCGYSFAHLNPYRSHLRTHDFDKLEEREKKLVVTEKPEYVCEICKKTFKAKRVLQTHLLRHGEKTFFCSDCGRGFTTKEGLRCHGYVHAGEKQHVCNFCGVAFVRKTSLQSHVRVHTGEKPYTCNVCQKSFAHANNFRVHTRIHARLTPFRYENKPGQN